MDGGEITLAAAFIAGVVSFASPCVLPVLPVYLATFAGSEETSGGKRRVLVNGLFFLSGFTLVFLAMGATASLLGQLFFDYQNVLRKIGAVFILVMGAHLAGALKLPGLERDWRMVPGRRLQGAAGAFLLGVAFTAGWTPCIGPILAAILMYAGMDGTVSQGVSLLAAYSMGFAVPFLLLSVIWGRYVVRIRSMYRWLPLVQKITGLALMAIGALIYFNWMPRLLSILLGG